MISLLVFGPPKVGKTWLALSAPRPILLLDSEAGGARFHAAPQDRWDPKISRQPPDPDTVEAACVADVHTLADAARIARTVNPEGWGSIVIDSLTELQARTLDTIARPRGEDWQALLRDLRSLLVAVRDRWVHHHSAMGLVIAGEAVTEQGRSVPLLVGKSAAVTGHWADQSGHLTIAEDDDGAYRSLALSARPHSAAGGRLGGIVPDDWADPDLSELAAHLRAKLPTRMGGQTPDRPGRPRPERAAEPGDTPDTEEDH